MVTRPYGIPEAAWMSWPAGAKWLIMSQQEELDELRSQLTDPATELASLRVRIGRSPRNSSKPPSEVVTFTGQFWPLTTLTPEGRNRVRPRCRDHREFFLPGSWAAFPGSTSTEGCSG